MTSQPWQVTCREWLGNTTGLPGDKERAPTPVLCRAVKAYDRDFKGGSFCALGPACYFLFSSPPPQQLGHDVNSAMILRDGVRSAALRWQRYPRCKKFRGYASTSSDPLRVLFCGADDFSIASLEALQHEQSVNPDLIKSIDVVCKMGKRHGRGLKIIREGTQVGSRIRLCLMSMFVLVPIATAARQLSLPLHQIDTFTKWQVWTMPCRLQ